MKTLKEGGGFGSGLGFCLALGLSINKNGRSLLTFLRSQQIIEFPEDETTASFNKHQLTDTGTGDWTLPVYSLVSCWFITLEIGGHL